MVREVRNTVDISKAGMLLCHNGFVRDTSRVGAKPVESIELKADHSKVEEIRQWALKLPGIVAVEIEPFEGKFQVGDDLLYIVMAGDIRENVFAGLRSTLDRVKSEAVNKKEAYKD